MEEEKEVKDVCEKIIEHSEDKINEILDKEGITRDNIMYLGQVVDIHKDIANEKYWKEKIDMYYRGNYSNYGRDDSYGRGRSRDSRGRYTESGRGYSESGRGGNYGRYRGHDYIDEMDDNYSRYMESRGRYGANDSETMESFKYMLKSFKDYYKHLKNEASSQEEVRMLDDTAREMLDM